MRATAALLYCCFLFNGSYSATAKDKIKVEIVEATNKIVMLPHTVPGHPEQIETHCSASVAGNTANGDCNTAVKPATEAAARVLPHFLFSAKAILSDGSHAALVCFAGDKDCAGIAPMVPEKSSSSCDTAGNVTTCTTKNLGVYKVKRVKNDLIIYGPKGI